MQPPDTSPVRSDPDLIIEATGLSKTFTTKRRTVTAVTDLDLRVHTGELVAFLGPNGAGKSTSLRMLTTLLPPTSGTAVVAGHSIATDASAVRARIGYVGQGNSAGHYQRVRDEMLSQGAFYGLSAAQARVRADELLESLQLGDLAKRQVLSLSGGQRRRLDIALGLVHRPVLLFLDEPSTGLDPQSRANLWEHILELRRQTGTTVFFSTHYLEEADQLAERVMIMDNGRVIADDTAVQLKANLAGDRITLEFADESQSRSAAAALGEHGVGQVDGAVVELTVRDAAGQLPGVVRALDAAGLNGYRARTHVPTLDDVFLTLTGRSLREEQTGTAGEEDPDAPDGRGASDPGASTNQEVSA